MSTIRQNMPTYLTVRTNVNLSDYTNIRAFIRQEDVELEFAVAVVSGNPYCAVLALNKNKAEKLKDIPAKIQLVMQAQNGLTVSHDPIVIKVGELVWRNGYGD